MQQASEKPADSTMRFYLCEDSIEINENFTDKIWGMPRVCLNFEGWDDQVVNVLVIFLHFFLTVDKLICMKVGVGLTSHHHFRPSSSL